MLSYRGGWGFQILKINYTWSVSDTLRNHPSRDDIVQALRKIGIVTEGIEE